MGKRIKLMKYPSIGDFLSSKYYEKFGNDEFIDLINSGRKEEAKVWWDREVRNKEVPFAEFKDFFYKLDKKRKPYYPIDNWVMSMIQVATILGPNVVDDEEGSIGEVIPSQLFKEEVE